MRVVVFSGTTEGRVLSAKLAEMGALVTVSVATEIGREEQGDVPGVTVQCGRLETPAMTQLLKGSSLCIDATHPYAVQASANIRAACAQAGVAYQRLLRAASPLPQGSLVYQDAAACAQALAQEQGNILLTTGAKELAAWSALDPARLYPRVLPTHEGLTACEALGIPHRNIIAMQGPFTFAMNEALLHQFKIRFLVTKDGGVQGGFAEKAAAAQAAGAKLAVISRPAEHGKTEEEILTFCKERL